MLFACDQKRWEVSLTKKAGAAVSLQLLPFFFMMGVTSRSRPPLPLFADRRDDSYIRLADIFASSVDIPPIANIQSNIEFYII